MTGCTHRYDPHETDPDEIPDTTPERAAWELAVDTIANLDPDEIARIAWRVDEDAAFGILPAGTSTGRRRYVLEIEA